MVVYKAITTVLVIIGVLGTFLPMLPGTPLILIGAVIHSYATGFNVPSINTLIILGLLVILGEGLQYLLSMIGAQKFGASKLGAVGGMFGLIVGLFTLGPIGLIVGPPVGAILIELIRGRPLDQAIRVGVGSLFGVLGGVVATFIIALLMAGWVLYIIF